MSEQESGTSGAQWDEMDVDEKKKLWDAMPEWERVAVHAFDSASKQRKLLNIKPAMSAADSECLASLWFTAAAAITKDEAIGLQIQNLFAEHFKERITQMSEFTELMNTGNLLEEDTDV